MAATQVASLFGLIGLKDELTPGLDKAKGGLTAFGENLQSMGQKVTGFGVGLTAMGAPFLAFAAKAVQSASESEDALAQLDAVLKSTGGAAGVTRDELTSMAESLQKTTRYSDEATIGAESMLLTFTNVGKTVFPRATKAILDLSTAMKQDTKSSAIQLGKALNDPIEGITSLTRVGVTFTQSQKDMIKSMVEAGDVAGAQTLILAELEKEFGGSAEAAGKTFAGSLDILKNRFDNVLETLGTALIPVIQEFTGWIGKLISWFEQLDPGTQQAIAMFIALGAALAVVGPIIVGIGLAITSVGTIISGIGVLLAGPLIPIGLLIGGLVLLAQHFGITFEQVQLYLSLIALYAGYYLGNVVTAITDVINGLGDGPKGLLAAIAVVAGPVGIGLLLATTGPLGILAAIAGAIALLGSQPGGFQGALATAGQAARDLMGILGVLLKQLKDVVDQLTGNVKTGIEGIKNIVSGVTSGQFSFGDVGRAVAAEPNPLPHKTGAFASPQGIAAVNAYLANNGLVPIPAPPAALGIPDVPRDNMLFRLHEGERVLTKDENKGGAGDTINVYVTASSYEGGRAAGQGAMDAILEKKRSRGG